MTGSINVPRPVVVGIAIVTAVGALGLAWHRAGALQVTSDIRPHLREIPKPQHPPIDPGNDLLMMGGPRPAQSPAEQPAKKATENKK